MLARVCIGESVERMARNARLPPEAIIMEIAERMCKLVDENTYLELSNVPKRVYDDRERLETLERAARRPRPNDSESSADLLPTDMGVELEGDVQLRTGCALALHSNFHRDRSGLFDNDVITISVGVDTRGRPSELHWCRFEIPSAMLMQRPTRCYRPVGLPMLLLPRAAICRPEQVAVLFDMAWYWALCSDAETTVLYTLQPSQVMRLIDAWLRERLSEVSALALASLMPKLKLASRNSNLRTESPQETRSRILHANALPRAARDRATRDREHRRWMDHMRASMPLSAFAR